MKNIHTDVRVWRVNQQKCMNPMYKLYNNVLKEYNGWIDHPLLTSCFWEMLRNLDSSSLSTLLLPFSALADFLCSNFSHVFISSGLPSWMPLKGGIIIQLTLNRHNGNEVVNSNSVWREWMRKATLRIFNVKSVDYLWLIL